MLWKSFSSVKAKLLHKRRMQPLVLVLALLATFAACASPVPTATLMPTAISRPTRTPAVATTLAPTDEPSATGTRAETETPTATFAPTSGKAGNADVLFVRAVQTDDGTWTFSVTVAHHDTGWEDYADGWDVLTPDGKALKPDPSSPFTRLLLHPHENEQPFTRSQSGIVIPDGVAQVRVRAHDLLDGYGGREVVVDLSVSSGSDFEVER